MKSSKRTWSEPELLSLRPARPADAARLLRWRNHPRARRASFHQGVISPAVHRRWLRRVLADPARRLYLFEVDCRPRGMVRFDRVGTAAAEVSLLLAPASQGRGLGRRLLRAARHLALLVLELRQLRARVKPGNLVSRNLFAGQGFELAAADRQPLEYRLELPGRPIESARQARATSHSNCA